MSIDKKHYYIEQTNLPFNDKNIYLNWFSDDIHKLIEAVRKDLEEEVLFSSVTINVDENQYLLINDKPEKWLRIREIMFI